MLSSLAEFKKEGALKKERAFPCTSFRKKKLLNSKRESTRLCASRRDQQHPAGRDRARLLTM
jgi:hypothetical protein